MIMFRTDKIVVDSQDYFVEELKLIGGSSESRLVVLCRRDAKGMSALIDLPCSQVHVKYSPDAKEATMRLDRFELKFKGAIGFVVSTLMVSPVPVDDREAYLELPESYRGRLEGVYSGQNDND